MNILMMTNTYTPMVGGLERSIQTFTEEYRRLGHRVLIVAPAQKDAPRREEGVVRVPALHYPKEKNYAIQLPVPGVLHDALENFRPDIVHAHHPFFIGDTALRVAWQRGVPLVYTYHTLFERNVEFVLGASETAKRFVMWLAAGFADLCDQVFAPSRGVLGLLRDQGVRSPAAVVPTGIDTARFSRGRPERLRKKLGLDPEVFVVGYVGRLAPEKNLEFLARAAVQFCRGRQDSVFLVVGQGSSEKQIRRVFSASGVQDRIFFTGMLSGQRLVDAYHAMNVFAFASKSETQGISLVEAMAAGVPVVALDACGIGDVLSDGLNGFLLKKEDEAEFARMLAETASMPGMKKEAMRRFALETAGRFSKDVCAERALNLYAAAIRRKPRRRDPNYVWSDSRWAQTRRQAAAEWQLVRNVTKAAAGAVRGEKVHVP